MSEPTFATNTTLTSIPLPALRLSFGSMLLTLRSVPPILKSLADNTHHAASPAPIRATVEVSADGLSAYVNVVPGEPMAASALHLALKGASVLYGLQAATLATLEAALADPLFEVKAELIARGTPPSPGRDAIFTPFFHPGIQAGSISSDGSFDYHDRDLLKPVVAGEVIATVTPAVPGIAGRRVNNETIPCPPVLDFALSLGPHVKLEPDGRICARNDGVVLYKAGQSLDVVQHYLHEGDVDLRSGDLAMQGTLVVKGSVRQSFQVVCSGDVEIQAGIEGGSVFAGGSVRVKQGVLGSDFARVEAGGSFVSKHAENARVYSLDLVKLEEATACELMARRIEVTRCLRGGTATAEHSLVTGQLGSPHSATDTLVIVGEPLPSPVSDAAHKLEAAKAARSAHRRSLSPRSLGTGARQKGGKLGREQAVLARVDLERRVERLKKRDVLLETAFIQVQGRIYPGARLQMGEDSLVIAEEASATRFTLDPETRRIRGERASS